jgi:hypothetical protein
MKWTKSLATLTKQIQLMSLHLYLLRGLLVGSQRPLFNLVRSRGVIWGADYGKCPTLRNFKNSAILCPMIKC